MNSLLLYCASGESLYTGAALLLAAVLASSYMVRPWYGRLHSLAMWMGIGMIVMSSPPAGWIFDGLFAASFGLWLAVGNRKAPLEGWHELQIATGASLIVFLLVLCVAELGQRGIPTIRGRVSDHLVVMGDSISSGIGPRFRTWPAVLQGTTGVKVRNLARPGATMADGISMADEVGPEDRLILIELGGNDLIAGTPSVEFGRSLENVLERLRSVRRTVVMFELPLIPTRIEYGQIQRNMAAKYGVKLIPKRFLVKVISGKEATTDGLHLTDVGARRMATLVAQVFKPALKVPPVQATAPATCP